MSQARVILLEFNELSPSLMTGFMGRGVLPNFKRLYDESEVHLTEAAECAPDLDPWIQWVTVHTGANFAEHKVAHLNEGLNFERKRIWDLASDCGLRVFVCGSMSVRYEKPINGWVIPDPWTTSVAVYPDQLTPYFSFIQRNVLEHTNEKVPLTRADYARFLRFMATHGLSVTTVSAIVRQLIAERGQEARWKRATLLDKLQFDLFRWYFTRARPHFSTFFLNSTAHYQHMYWREMEPDVFQIQPSPEEQKKFGDAILFGYQEMDGLVGRFLRLAGRDVTLVLCTALSQQPCLKFEDQGGKNFYRPRDFSRLLTLAGVAPPYRVSPVMAEQFFVYFEDEPSARAAEQRLSSVRVGNRQVLAVERNGREIFSGCHIFDQVSSTALLTVDATASSVPFFSVFYQVEGMKSGMHHPDGLLWIRTPDRRHKVGSGKMPLSSVAPKLLDLLALQSQRLPSGSLVDSAAGA